MMKKIGLVLLGAFAMLFLINWGTPESNYDGPSKSSVNFYGILETWQGQVYNVENISIEGYTSRIPFFYEKPVPSKTEEPAADLKDKKIDSELPYVLKQNPMRDFVKTKIDLHEIRYLEVPDPEHNWIYKKKKGMHETEYVEVIITSKDAQETKTSYLIESRKKLFCDRALDAGPEWREVPLAAIKKLTIQGFRYREPDQQEKRARIIEDTPMTTPGTRPAA